MTSLLGYSLSYGLRYICDKDVTVLPIMVLGFILFVKRYELCNQTMYFSVYVCGSAITSNFKKYTLLHSIHT